MNTGDDMTMSPDKSLALVSAQASRAVALPAIVQQAGPAAVFAAEEFFYGYQSNNWWRELTQKVVVGSP
jgi:hypothetical protein